jgi:hypothetical protein
VDGISEDHRISTPVSGKRSAPDASPAKSSLAYRV